MVDREILHNIEEERDSLPPPPYNGSTAVTVTQDKKDVTDTDDSDDTVKEPERGEWGSQLEFILTCVGYAVGLGNVWRFPYLCYRNGGGAFLIPYFLMLLFVGIPIFYLELSFGQFSSLGPIAIWNINPLMKGLGYTMVIVNTIIAMYYNVIIAWSLYYFFASMNTKLSWENCGNWWNTDNCFQADYLNDNCTRLNTSIACDDGRLINNSDIKTPSEEYFYNQVLRITDGIDDMGQIRWQLACCLLLCWTIVFFVLIKGISSLGKVVYFSSTFPYILLTIMLIRGVTLPGAATGIEYYLKPDFSRLADAQVWSDAATQIFYSLSACTGGLIAMASYNKFSNNVLRDSIMVPLINCGTSFYAGFVIFSVLGFMAEEKGVTVDDVADDGPGLVFVVYPEGLTQMPVSPLWAILFFFMLITLGFSSEFSMSECFFSSFIDEFPAILRRSRRNNIIFRICGICVFFLATLPMVTEGGFYLFNLVDVFISGFPLLFVGFFELLAISYIYGFNRFAEDIVLMIGRKPGIFFKVTWIVISPLLLFTIIIFMAVQYSPPSLFGDYVYPSWALGIGWCVVGGPLVFIPGYCIYQLLRDGGWELIKQSSRPTKGWGPANQSDRKGRYALQDEQKVNEEATSDISNGTSTVFRVALSSVSTDSPGLKTKYGMDNPGFEKDIATHL